MSASIHPCPISDPTERTLIQAAADFTGNLTGLKPPPIDDIPPDLLAAFRTFAEKVRAIAASAPAQPLADGAKQWEPMTDQQRARWNQTGLFPVERWDLGGDSTPLVCPTPTHEELRSLAAAVPEHIQLSGWYIGKPAFGHHYLYADNFSGMGRQWVCDFPADKSYFGGLAEYVAAVHPRTVIHFLDRIAELEAQPSAAQCQVPEALDESKDRYDFQRAYSQGWNACRNAMLASTKEAKHG